MIETDTIYPLKKVFDDLLEDAGCHNFLIPTYQRGYKWASGDGKGQVDRLLKDLKDAFEQRNKGGRGSYYLQFITLKKNKNSLEVIDGQQRLTTITILFSVLKELSDPNTIVDFVGGKLIYEARNNFVHQFIYQNIDSLLDSDSWDDFIEENEEYNNQDIYFIYKAAQTVALFFKEHMSTKLEQFYQFVANDVFLIINLLDTALNSEKVFVNVNKGVKLNDEDLIKGLLITKIPEDVRDIRYRMTDIELNEIRSNLGRQWDEIATWSNRNEVKDFFKVNLDRQGKGIEWLIRLAYPSFKSDESGNALFNFFDEKYRSGELNASSIFKQIRRTKLLLEDWFCNPEIANLLGYVLHSHSQGRRGLNEIYKTLEEQSSKSDVLSILKDLALEFLPISPSDGALDDINYEDHWGLIYNLFLMLDVAKFLPIDKRKSSFYNFSNIIGKEWSLEHVFPQNSKDFKNVSILQSDDIAVIRELLPRDPDKVIVDDEANLKNVQQVYRRIMEAEATLELREEEIEPLGLLLNDNAKELHGIGNLALLQKNINSSLSNHFFESKRTILVNKISQGNFIPFHTHDVFSKLIIPGATGVHTWSRSDIEVHEKYIRAQLLSIFIYLTTKNKS